MSKKILLLDEKKMDDLCSTHLFSVIPCIWCAQDARECEEEPEAIIDSGERVPK